ncbi:MAG: ribosomal protein L11 methyltransferase [Verrucomicrobia bacterium]|jgi:ribosomal protein L11 methyltransferase|nr:MAG: ribosomal protein L11 methyltransferase [Verrucomicrobiota bacterium]
MDLCEIKVEIPAGRADEADNVMLELGIEGWSLLEDAIAQRAWVVGIFSGETEAKSRWGELSGLLPGLALGEPVRRMLADGDWRDSYKAHFKAWRFGRLHWVPVWERAGFQLPAGDEVLWLDPGMAFGTGNHETTRLCVERLTELEARQVAAGGARGCRRVIDAGCGSGILALSAAKLGFEEVVGFDNDPEAVKVSEENAELNGLTGRVPFYVGDLVSGLAGKSADVLLANILANILIQFAPQLIAAVAPGGTLVLSGILAVESAQVREVFAVAAPGWTVESRVLGEWSDVVLTRTN